MDREKVIKEWESVLSRDPLDVPWDLIDETLVLLKEQEAVKPHYNARTNWYECGNCHYSMTSGMHCRSELIPAYKVGFCAKCGRGVMWE